jgi:4'-phosphopantetheinyl transferase
MECPVRITVWTLESETMTGHIRDVLADLLGADEQTRAARFLHDHDRRDYIAAHALKRIMISALTGTPPATCRFETQQGGKPILVHPGELHFNLSHCKGLVAVAASAAVPVGVDVELVSVAAPLDIAPTIFAPAELAWLDALAPASRPEGFIRLWTLKEAYIKATGRGLSEPLDGFAFGFDPLAITFRDPIRSDAAGWCFAEHRLVRHRLALAWQGPADTSVSLRAVRPEDLQGR